MADRRQVMYDIERCICHVPDACRDCSHYGHGEVVLCMEELLNDVLTLLKEQPEIVRCKDCTYLNADTGICIVGIPHGHKDTFYYAYGKRR